MMHLSRLSPARHADVSGTPISVTGASNEDDDGAVSGTMTFGHNGVSPVTWTVTAPDGTDATGQLDDDTADAPVLTRRSWTGLHGGTWTVRVDDAAGNVGWATFIVGRLYEGVWWVKVYEVDFTAEVAHDFKAGGPAAIGTPARTWTRVAGGDGLGNAILGAGGGYQVSCDGDGRAGITTPLVTMLGAITGRQSYALLARAAPGQLAGASRYAGVEVSDLTPPTALLWGRKVHTATVRSFVMGQVRGGGAYASGTAYTANDTETTALVVRGYDVDLRSGAWAPGWPTLGSLASEKRFAVARSYSEAEAWSFDGDMTIGLMVNRDVTAGTFNYAFKELSAWVAK